MPNISPVDDSESFPPQRPNIHADTPFAALKEDNDIPITLHLSPPELSTPRDITNDVVVFPIPLNPLTLSYKFEGSERLEDDGNYEENDVFSDPEDHVEEEHVGASFVQSFEEDSIAFVPFTCELVDSTSLESYKSEF